MTDNGVDPSMRICFADPHDPAYFQRILAFAPETEGFAVNGVFLCHVTGDGLAHHAALPACLNDPVETGFMVSRSSSWPLASAAACRRAIAAS